MASLRRILQWLLAAFAPRGRKTVAALADVLSHGDLWDKNCAARGAAHVRSALQRADFCAEIGNAFQPVRDAFLEAAKLVNDI